MPPRFAIYASPATMTRTSVRIGGLHRTGGLTSVPERGGLGLRGRHWLLTAVEQQMQPMRQQITTHLAAARQLPDFAGVADRHRRAAEAVARVIAMDDESLQILQRADADRRTAAQSLETGEATLAAYRRILQQPAPSAGLFNQRG